VSAAIKIPTLIKLRRYSNTLLKKIHTKQLKKFHYPRVIEE